MTRIEAIEFLLLRLRDPQLMIRHYGVPAHEVYPVLNLCLSRRMLSKSRAAMFDIRPSGYIRYANLYPLASQAGLLVRGDPDHTLAPEYALPQEVPTAV